jgi:hypothetical protein
VKPTERRKWLTPIKKADPINATKTPLKTANQSSRFIDCLPLFPSVFCLGHAATLPVDFALAKNHLKPLTTVTE